MSLSPRPDTVSTTTSSGLNFNFFSAPSAWADSSAGMIPSGLGQFISGNGLLRHH